MISGNPAVTRLTQEPAVLGSILGPATYDLLNTLKPGSVSQSVARVATVRENKQEMKLFPCQGKVREFCGWSWKFRRKTWKVRE